MGENLERDYYESQLESLKMQYVQNNVKTVKTDTQEKIEDLFNVKETKDSV